MLLWKQDVYATRGELPRKPPGLTDPARPWLNWPRPPGGFLDLG